MRLFRYNGWDFWILCFCLQEAQQMVAQAYKTAEEILTTHRDKLDKVGY